ncbi:MFS general substrate transporter [Zopfia rhizophila CBS 207.26]|uniref:MFS general substrate transporter n=1 Tax=Zopfia rhizophila CBS 207.26 TaxID=1314779 RepID=A0A6A6DLX1_9PEZI|nr:MFS general substrate transporter [Zopfia rhizophila CBS 207.26]
MADTAQPSSGELDGNMMPSVGFDARSSNSLEGCASNAYNVGSKRSIKGATAATSQVKLKPKPPESHALFSDDVTLNSLGFEEPEGGGFTLPPADKGFGAWSYVAAAFAMYIVVWGFPNAFPIFQTYLSSGEKAQYRDSMILPILAPGIQDILEGIFFQILPKLARYRRLLVIIGIAIMIVAIFMASCATTAWQIVLTQGILFGCGGIILNFVHVSVFIEWFTEEKQSQAMSIIWAGYRVGELAFPPVCQWLLDKHGYEETLRVLIAPMLALLLPSIMLLRGRYPVAQVTTEPPSPPGSKLAALRSPNVLFHLLISLMLDLVINVPTMFVTRFGADIGLGTPDIALALSVYTLCNLVGTTVFGWISHSGNYESLLALCAVTTSLSHLLIWGFTTTKFGLFGYAIAAGISSGGQDNCLYPFYSEISGKDGDLYRTIHSLFSFVGGIAILSVGPVGVALLRLSPDITEGAYALGKYQVGQQCCPASYF